MSQPPDQVAHAAGAAVAAVPTSSGEQNALFREVVERSRDAVFVHVDGRLIYVNPAAVHMVGLDSADTLLDRDAFDLVHPEDRGKSAARIERLHAGEALPRDFQRMRRADGSVVLGEVESYLVPWFGARAVAAVIRDVTQEHAVLEALRRTHAALETAPDPVFIIDVDRLRHVQVNDAACRMLGYTPDELLACGPVEIGVDSDRHFYESLYTGLESRGEGVSVADVRVRHLRCKDGRTVPVEVRRSFLGSGGRRFVTAVARDVSERLAAQGELARFRTAMDIAPDAIMLVDVATMRFIDVNDTACRMLCRTRAELLSLGPVDVNPSMTRADFESRFSETIRKGEGAISLEPLRWVTRADGTRLPVEVHRTSRTIDGRLVIVSIVRDLSDRMRADRDLRLRTRALEAAGNPILILDVHADPDRIVWANPAVAQLTGWRIDELIERSWTVLLGDDLDQPALAPLQAAMLTRMQGKAELRCRRRDGTLFWNSIEVSPVPDEGDGALWCVMIGEDVTDEHLHQDELRHRATHDALTGLANRRLFDDRIAVALASAQRHARVLAVVFTDLDHFKQINDTLGHAAGDALLRSVAARLLACVREGDTVSRQGGDEFVLLLTDQADRASVEIVLSRIRDAVSRPHDIDGRTVQVGCSLGASLYPEHGDDPAQLIRSADRAMYAAKQAGRDTWRIADTTGASPR